MLTKITQEVFDAILNDHKELDGYIIGNDIKFPEEVRDQVFTHCEFVIPLNGIKFTNVGFNYVDCSSTDFIDYTFNNCDFSYCKMKCHLSTGCIFSETKFNFCNLNGSVIRKCAMSMVAFTCSALYGVVFEDADVKFTQFYSCEMDNCDSCNSNIIFPCHVPSEGSFIAWKKAISVDDGNIIIKLRIPEDAKRFCINNKCRANKVEVLGFETIDGEKLPDTTIVNSVWDPLFKYHIGIIEICTFNDNPQVECGSGIHFFLSRDDAVNYVF